MSEPRRAGLMELLMTSSGCQFVIPVYQRNYTWNADREVKQYLSDLKQVLKGTYKNHFLGILIYLDKSIDFSTRELSIIDGQQRLTTTFLTLYVVKEMFKNNGEVDRVQQLEGQYLTNPYHKDKIKYKLKPLVADDDVYRCIVEDRFGDIENTNSTVIKNYNYISTYLNTLVSEGYSPNDILIALNKLYVVCVPISEEDNAQKIFESINATGVKLTAADLIRNFTLMNLNSDLQDKYYECYWKKIEDNVSSDSKELEMFFRMYLALKKFELVPKNSVYRSFVDWVNEQSITVEQLFKDLLNYAKIYNKINTADIAPSDKEILCSLTDFRKIKSDLPISIVMEFYKLYQMSLIDARTLAELINSINAYLIRRSICDMNSQNISKLFPVILKKVMEKCNGNYKSIVAVLNQEMVGNNADTSGSYMPTDLQMHDFLYNANVYKRPALRIILDRLELNDNPAPVDLSCLSVEHLMPQTPTEEWLAELETDEETYLAYLHRLGNLTLASKVDNSKMGNLQWEYKNKILEDTTHLKMNMELLPIKKWTLNSIDKRTTVLINKICKAFPYPEVSINPKSNDTEVDEKTARNNAIKQVFSESDDIVEIKKDTVYMSADSRRGYVLLTSKMYPEGEREKYWFGYKNSRFEKVKDCNEKYCILICRSKTTLIMKFPKTYLDDMKGNFNCSLNDDGSVMHYHIVLHKNPDGRITLLLSRPILKRIDVTDYFVAEV